jgi:hypothetical protein
MKKAVVLVLILALTACVPAHYKGAGAGGAVGGIAGALIDKKNPWRGGVIGAALGATLGATLTEISMQGSKEAAETGRPVEYRSSNNRQIYRAEPVSQAYSPDDGITKCRKVRESVYENGQKTKDIVKEVCTGTKTEQGY